MINLKDICKYTRDLDVLYVEDEETLRNENIALFEDFFEKVDGAVNGTDGLRKYKEFYKKNGFYYDIVITDINMPSMGGHKLIEELHDINQEQHIVVISAYSESSRLITLIDQGIESFILKPVKIDQLLHTFYKVSKHIQNNKLADKHHKCTEALNKQLEESNDILNKKVQQQVKLVREKDKMLFQQSKLAAMGEMIDAIAHQWKQPLSIVAIQTSMMRYNLNNGQVITENDILTVSDEIDEQVNLLVETIDEFRKFFRTNIKKENVPINQEIKKVLLLLKNTIKMNSIQIDILGDENLCVYIAPNEFKHIIINLVNNSKDAFIENEINDRKIFFELLKEDKGVLIKVKDNAGGIPEAIIDKIFIANFTTKEDGQGTGIGLYMSNLIVEKMGGKIWAENHKDGVCFNIFIPNEL